MGFHRSWEPGIVHNKQETTLRQRIWSSLFVLDRFLAASLGRPLAIQNKEHPVSHMDDPTTETQVGSTSGTGSPGSIVTAGYRLGVILDDMRFASPTVSTGVDLDDRYSDRRTSITIDASDVRSSWSSTAQALARLQWRLLNDHATILEHRDAFLTVFLRDSRKLFTEGPTNMGSRSDASFATPCISAAMSSISMARHALSAGILPSRTPFMV